GFLRCWQAKEPQAAFVVAILGDRHEGQTPLDCRPVSRRPARDVGAPCLPVAPRLDGAVPAVDGPPSARISPQLRRRRIEGSQQLLLLSPVFLLQLPIAVCEPSHADLPNAAECQSQMEAPSGPDLASRARGI